MQLLLSMHTALCLFCAAHSILSLVAAPKTGAKCALEPVFPFFFLFYFPPLFNYYNLCVGRHNLNSANYLPACEILASRCRVDN